MFRVSDSAILVLGCVLAGAQCDVVISKTCEIKSELPRMVVSSTSTKLSDVAEPSSSAEAAISTKESEIISKLLDSCFERSPDVQFVLQKLLGGYDSSHAKLVLSRFKKDTISSLSTSQCGFDPLQIFAETKTDDVESIHFDQKRVKAAKAKEGGSKRTRKLTSSEQIQTFQLLRRISDPLVVTYRVYVRAREDRSTLSGTEAARNQIELVKARQSLIDMAGRSAVYDLDADLDSQPK